MCTGTTSRAFRSSDRKAILIFDGGTGLRLLGKKLMKEEGPITAHMFFSHVHWDHIQGFPFFRSEGHPHLRRWHGAAPARQETDEGGGAHHGAHVLQPCALGPHPGLSVLQIGRPSSSSTVARGCACSARN